MLTGKTAIITGAARGIGRSIALTLAGAGTRIGIGDVDLTGAEAVGQEIRHLGQEVEVGYLDVTDRGQVETFVARAVGRFGRIDILVNNAGIFNTHPLEEISPEEWDRVMAVNLKGAFLCTQAVVPVMKAQSAGKIVNVASRAGKDPHALGPHYAASKAGVIALTRSMAKYLAPFGIMVNALAPGPVDTDLIANWQVDIDHIPLRRLARAEEIAGAVLYLVSPAASYITGETLNINGGMLMD